MNVLRGIIRLIDGLLTGDPDAPYVLVFAIAGTVIIYLGTEVIRKRRKP